MLNRLASLREERENEDGFTLIELLVVVVIIGILIAIAIPLYSNYRKGANDKAAASDLRGAISTLEQCNTDNAAYPGGFDTTSKTFTGSCTNASVKASDGTSFAYFAKSDGSDFIMTASNSKGTPGKTYCYASAAGGSVSQLSSGTSVTSWLAACP